MPTANNMVFQGTMLVSFKNKLEREIAEGSDITKAIVSSSTSKEILLKYEIDHDKINIIVNRDQRPATGISGSQGDHVTAYTVLLQTICGLIDGEEVHDAPKILYDATSCFLEDFEGLEFKSYKTGQTISFESKLREVQAKFFPKQIRKKLTNSLKTIQNITAEINHINVPELKDALSFIRSCSRSGKKKLNIDKLKSCVKRSNQELFAQLVVDLGEQVLKKYNQQSTAAFPKLKEDYGKNTGEGTRVKTAMLNLRLLNKLLKLKKNTNESNINDFKTICNDIIKAAMPQIKDEQIVNAKFSNCLNLLFNLDDQFKKKKIKIDLNNIGEYLDQIDIDKSIKAKEVGKLFNDLFDFKLNKISHMKLSDPLVCLYEVTARHTNFIFKAFNNLISLPIEVRTKIIDGFHEKVIEKAISASDNCQGWGEWLIYNPTIGASTYFNKQNLAQGVNEYNNRYPSVREYRAFKKHRKLNAFF